MADMRVMLAGSYQQSSGNKHTFISYGSKCKFYSRQEQKKKQLSGSSSTVKFVVCKGYSVDVAPVLRVDETTRNEGERFEVERMLEEDCCNETTQCRARRDTSATRE